MRREVIKINKPGKNNFVVTFEEEGQEREWVGLIRAEEKGAYRISVRAEHTLARTKGRVKIKAVVGKGARVELAGMIKITKKAQQTDSFLELRVLLVDETARARVEPRLEIEENEVKAGHAASVGRMDEEQVSYLMSRGLSRQQAEKEIIKGFISE